MVALRSLALFIAAAVASGQTIDSLDPCGRDCYNGAVAEFAKLGCGANDMACLCGKQDFKFAVRDCAMNACPPGYANTVVNAANALCATAVLPVSTAQPTIQPAPTTPPPSSTPQPVTSAAPTLTPQPSSSVENSAPAPASTTSSSSSSSSATSTLSTAAAESTSSTSGGNEAAAATSSSASAATSSPASAAADPSGLSTPAKIGIGAGAVLAVAALVVVGVWAIVRRSRKGRKGPGSMRTPIKISEPMPGAGRSYAHDHHYEAGLSELEMKSRPYEEMVPRQKPRHMV